VAGLSPDGGAIYAKAIADLYGQAVADLLKVVARRLARGIDEPGWAEAHLTQLLGLRADAQALVAALETQGPAAVASALEAAYRAGSLTVGGPTPAGLVAVNQRSVMALAKETSGALRSTHVRILRKAEDVFRQVVAETIGGSVTGAATRRDVAARALDRYAARGVTGYIDGAGRSWQLESYTEMATRTATGRAHVQGGIDRFVASGRDLVIVSDAPEECALCRPFEGAVLSLTGVDPDPGDVEGHRYMGSLDDAMAAGLLHPNCRHALNGYTPGLTRPFEATADPEGDRLRQRQRALERAVRESKRRVAALEPLGRTPELARQKALLRERQARIREFVAAHDRKRQPHREQLGAL
jgi:hypothetical protein